MSDLISREAVEHVIKNTFADYEWEYDSLLSKLENIPTVEAVSLSVIEKIKAEIERESDYKPYEMYDMKWAFNKALDIIDKAVKEYTHE